MVRGAASAIDAKSSGAGTSAVAKPQAVFARPCGENSAMRRGAAAAIES